MATIKKTDDGYLVRWQWYENGKRRGSKKTFEKAAEAKAFKAKVENEINGGNYAHAKGLSVGEYLADWLPTYCKHLADNTYADYQHCIDKYLAPGLGNIHLKDISTLSIQKFCNKLLETEYRPAKYEQRGNLSVLVKPAKTYSPKFVRNIFGVLSAALAKAVETRLIPFNPCSAVTLPTIEEKDYVIPTAEEFPKLIEALQTSEMFEAIIVCAMLGTRRGEALGLYWDDIDFVNDTITLRRAWIENRKEKKATIGKLKTKKSERILPMPAIVREELLKLKKKQEALRLERPDEYVVSPFVFVNEIGLPFMPHSLTQAITRAAARVGLDGLRLHDLRHAVGTYMIDAGESPKTVSEFLGHSSASFTMKRYVHGVDESKRRAASVMTRFIKIPD